MVEQKLNSNFTRLFGSKIDEHQPLNIDGEKNGKELKRKNLFVKINKCVNKLFSKTTNNGANATQEQLKDISGNKSVKTDFQSKHSGFFAKWFGSNEIKFQAQEIKNVNGGKRNFQNLNMVESVVEMTDLTKKQYM